MDEKEMNKDFKTFKWVHKNRLDDNEMFNASDYIKLQNIAVPVIPINPKDGTVTEDRLLTATHYPAVATNATVTVTAGQTWEIHEIYTMMQCDAGVANRVFDVTMTQTLSTLSLTTIDTTGVTLSANEIGGSTLTSGFSPNLWTNDNATLAVVADENPLPVTLTGGDTINAVSTNKQAGDLIELLVRYIREG